jgi:hypothetical protein
MAASLVGPYDWRATRDREGHRSYELWWLISVTNLGLTDDPSVVFNTAGLPVVGSLWSDLAWISGDDDWAFCTPEVEISPFESAPGEKIKYYLLKNVFTTEPLFRCQDDTIENPLDEPPEVSGGWVSKKTLAKKDRDDKPYVSSTGEPLKIEIDDSDWDVSISFNTASLDLATVNDLMHKLNDATLWGLAAEKVKFSKYSFTRKLYGTCTFYFTNQMHFTIRDSWVQEIPDVGRMCLGSGGDKTVPGDWIVCKDAFGENKPVLGLDVDGQPIVGTGQTQAVITRNPYNTGNLLLLGIPTSLETV